jgi:hypothetical protein
VPQPLSSRLLAQIRHRASELRHWAHTAMPPPPEPIATCGTPMLCTPGSCLASTVAVPKSVASGGGVLPEFRVSPSLQAVSTQSANMKPVALDTVLSMLNFHSSRVPAARRSCHRSTAWERRRPRERRRGNKSASADTGSCNGALGNCPRIDWLPITTISASSAIEPAARIRCSCSERCIDSLAFRGGQDARKWRRLPESRPLFAKRFLHRH